MRCCDICSAQCDCNICCPLIHLTEEEILTTIGSLLLYPSKERRWNLHSTSTEKVSAKSVQKLLPCSSNSLINQIASNCIIIKGPSQIVEMGLSSRVHAAEIFDIVQQIIG